MSGTMETVGRNAASRRVSRHAIILSIVAKDLREFSRDRLWMVMTPLTMLIVVAAVWLLPDTVDETITVGVYPPELAVLLEQVVDSAATSGAMSGATSGAMSGLEVITFTGKYALAAAVTGEDRAADSPDIQLGIALPDDFAAAVLTGAPTTVSIYTGDGVPEGMTNALSGAIREAAYALQALAIGKRPLDALPVTAPDLQTVVLGEDRAGNQVPLRDQMRPMLAIMILLVEALALAGLVAVEIERRTVTAVLVTPARTNDLLAAKGITGAILALSQVLFFLLVTGSFAGNWPLVATLMLLAAVMMTAVGLIAGSAGRDFMGTLFFGMAFIIPLWIPAIAVLFPGSTALWVKLLPSYGVIAAMTGVFGYGHGWGEVAPYIGAVLLWDAALLGTALVVLRRKVEAL